MTEIAKPQPETPAPPKPATKPAPAKPGAAPGDPAEIGSTEVGGRKGPDPTRYGDWEKDGRCVDF